MKNQKLSDDPLSLRIIPQEIAISLDQVLAENGVEEDPFFVEKHRKYLTGKLDGYITRVSRSRIKFGFYKRASNKWEYFINEVKDQEINALVRGIRGGYRPSLYVYRNPNEDCNHDFVCPYNGAVFHAYSTLGINKLPAIILGAESLIEESALKIKGFKRTDNSYIHFIYAAKKQNEKEKYPSSIGLQLSNDAAIDLIKIEKRITYFKSRLREFHVKRVSDVNYHKIIYAMLNEASEMVLSIRILTIKKLYIQAAKIARSLYELSLDFYLIWISPRAITEMFQIASVMPEREWQKRFDDDAFEEPSIKSKDKSAEQIKKANLYQYKLVKSIREKTRLSPFGETFYEEVYSFLSDIVHHDFSMVARYQNSLEHSDDSVYDADIRRSIVRMADACIGWMIVWLKDDIGNNVVISSEYN